MSLRRVVHKQQSPFWEMDSSICRVVPPTTAPPIHFLLLLFAFLLFFAFAVQTTDEQMGAVQSELLRENLERYQDATFLSRKEIIYIHALYRRQGGQDDETSRLAMSKVCVFVWREGGKRHRTHTHTHTHKHTRTHSHSLTHTYTHSLFLAYTCMVSDSGAATTEIQPFQETNLRRVLGGQIREPHVLGVLGHVLCLSRECAIGNKDLLCLSHLR